MNKKTPTYPQSPAAFNKGGTTERVGLYTKASPKHTKPPNNPQLASLALIYPITLRQGDDYL